MSGSQAGYGSLPAPNDAQYGNGYGTQDFAVGKYNMSSPLAQSMPQSSGFRDDYDASQRGDSIVGSGSVEGSAGFNRAVSSASTAVPAGQQLPSRNNTLRKRSSMRRTSSLKRSSSKRSLKAGSLAGFGGVNSNQEYNSFAFTPVPTSGTPTEVLANRFQAWRQLLKSLITYFREIQASYDARQKAVLKVQNTVANIMHPSVFMSEHGLGDATRILDDFHKKTIAEANKSRDIEADVIGALTGLRNDLGQKIKEIKSLSGDFKNSVEKEKDATRKAVEQLQDALAHADHEDGTAMGKNDPFVVRLGVDRMVEKQIDEENYLHRAYLNLESSGRELESIVVGEIQKAFNALAGILKREGDDAYNTVDLLRSGPISIPKDAEWVQFVTKDEQFVDPSMPIRRIEDIHYPGKDHPGAAEIRAGMLERKSKYLKSYTPGWYVLSATHLHEFKSADKIFSQPPVMSLYLLDQKLGSRSQEDSSSHKFMLKGKQSGSMHKGHNWVFRAESYDTMVAWYNDIKALTESTGEQRTAFVRKHARSVSAQFETGTISSDGLEEDEADAIPYSADAANLSAQNQVLADRPVRPQPGGRFPSDLRIPQNRDAARDASSDSDDDDAAADLTAPVPRYESYGGQDPYRLAGVATGGTQNVSDYTNDPGVGGSCLDYVGDPDTSQPPITHQDAIDSEAPHPQPYAPVPVHQLQQPSFLANEPVDAISAPLARSHSDYGEWLAPTAIAGAAGAGLGAAAFEAHHHARDEDVQQQQMNEAARAPTAESLSQSIDGTTAVAAVAAVPVAVKTGGGGGGESLASDSLASSIAPDTPKATVTGGLAGRLAGNESFGAHETGSMFPTVRHESRMSISALHVPGKFPKKE